MTSTSRSKPETITIKSPGLYPRISAGSNSHNWPRRVACLSAETTELAFNLIHPDRIVGVSGYCVRPAEARLKPKVAAFTTIRLEKILELKPDLILGFSDLQKDIARELIGLGFNVFIINPRTIDEIADSFLAVGRLLGEEKKAESLRGDFLKELETLSLKTKAVLGKARPRVYFEEWDEPLITGISWVHDLIEMFGARDVFAHKSAGKTAKERTVTFEEVVSADPEVIIGSWCGKKVRFEKMTERPGWHGIKAVSGGHLYEIKSPDILAPGLSLLYGARKMAEILGSYSTA